MSPATQLAALFTRFVAEERDVVWLADEFLTVVAGAKRVHLTRRPDRSADGLYCRVDGGPGGTAEALFPQHQWFRLFLARLAKLHAAEHGTEPLPYGGRLVFARDAADGPVRIDGTFANSVETQHLTLTVSDPKAHP